RTTTVPGPSGRGACAVAVRSRRARGGDLQAMIVTHLTHLTHAPCSVAGTPAERDARRRLRQSRTAGVGGDRNASGAQFPAGDVPQSAIDALLDSPAMAIARAIRTKAASSTEVTQAFLARIRDRNPPINAAVQVADERALAEARAAAAALARGDALGPFHGVPFTVKDVFDTAGIVTAVGFPERAAYVPDVDAVTVARLRA